MWVTGDRAGGCALTSKIGWTMWNIFLGGMLTGATLVLYDGSPFYPSPAEQLHFVISLGYIPLPCVLKLLTFQYHCLRRKSSILCRT